MSEKEGCQCEWHKWYNEFKIQLEKVSPGDRIFFENMAERMMETEEQLSYNKAIINGQWIDADEVIAFRRKKLAEKL